MKPFKHLISAGLALSLLLAACAPIVSPENPPAPYPTEPTVPGQNASGDVLTGTLPYEPNPVVAEADITALSNASNAFALGLYHQLSGTQGNLFYSPYSIFQALMMTYAGAAGVTAEQMSAALYLPITDVSVHATMNALNASLLKQQQAADPSAQPLILTIANALWGQAGFSFDQAFLDTLSANYAAGLRLVDFSKPEEARALINTWVAAQTNDKIRDLIPAGVLDEMTRLVLTNAVYFKGAWRSQFDTQATRNEPFYNADGVATDVAMMHQYLTTGAIQNGNLTAIRLPYENGDCAMIILMPTQGSLTEFETGLSVQSLTDVMSQLNSSSASVNLGLPKFTFDASFSLSDMLKSLGMPNAFDPTLADFSGMTAADKLFIQDVLHKAYVDVNEEGTEAAAATAVIVGTTSMPSEVLEITFDHPFVFAIECQGTLLFLGRVAQP